MAGAKTSRHKSTCKKSEKMPRYSRCEKNQENYPAPSVHLSVPWLINRLWFSSVHRSWSLCRRLLVRYLVCRTYRTIGSIFRGIGLFSYGSFARTDYCSICGCFGLPSVLLGYENSAISQEIWKHGIVLHFNASRIIYFC